MPKIAQVLDDCPHPAVARQQAHLASEHVFANPGRFVDTYATARSLVSAGIVDGETMTRDGSIAIALKLVA
jgi:hypothetical protein